MLLGDLLIWYYENLAGIRNADDSEGFRHIEMKPCFPDGLGRVAAKYRSASGEIESRWERKGDRLKWNVAIPANCKATLYLPKQFNVSKPEMRDGITEISDHGSDWLIELGSGKYTFE